MRRVVLVVLLAAASMVSGCAVTDSVAERFSPDEDTGPRVATIGVVAPLSGGQTRVGRSVVDAVEQAVADSEGVPGWQIEVASYDLGAQSFPDDLAEIKTDDSTVAVITGFGADDIRTIVPELDESGLAVLSPADSDPRHVRGANPAEPLRPWPGYFTIAVDPAPEQTALADHLVRVVGVKRAVVVTDGSGKSATRGRAVQRALEQRSLTRVSSFAWTGATLTRPEQQALDRLRPGDVLVVDAPAETAAQIAGNAPDGVAVALASAAISSLDDQPADVAEALDGALVPMPGADPKRGANELVSTYAAADRDATVGPYGPAGYDAARLVLDAFTVCLPDAANASSPSRLDCRKVLAGATWTGLTGPIQFDEFGARLGLLPTVAALAAPDEEKVAD
jgi:branched-chain amino acid transport system substrate-binding protein